MELELRHLELIHVIFQNGSINSAARELGISQPTLTAQVQRLERHFGLQIFNRSSSGVTLTGFGRTLVSRTSHLLTLFTDVSGLLSRRITSIDEPLRFGSESSSIAKAVMSVLLANPRADGISIRGDLTDTEASAMLGNGQLEMAVLTEILTTGGPHYPPGVKHQNLGTSAASVIVGRDHPLWQRETVSIADLAKESWLISTSTGGSQRATLYRACESNGFVPLIVGEVESADVVNLVAEGLGIGLTSSLTSDTEMTRVVHLTGDEVPLLKHVLAWRADGVSDEEVNLAYEAGRRRLIILANQSRNSAIN